MSPLSFYSLTIREANLVLQGYEDEKKNEYYLNLYALKNAIGTSFGGKDYKIIDPFKVENDKSKKTSKKEREETLNYLREKFKKFGGDI